MLTLFIVKERAIWVMPLANAPMPLFVIEILSIESVFKLCYPFTTFQFPFNVSSMKIKNKKRLLEKRGLEKRNPISPMPISPRFHLFYAKVFFYKINFHNSTGEYSIFVRYVDKHTHELNRSLARLEN